MNLKILFCSGGGVFGRLIRWTTGSKWSHCALVLLLDPAGLMVLQSYQGYGTQLVPLASFLERYDGEVWWVELKGWDNVKLRDLTIWGFARLGLPYSWLEIGKIATRILIGAPVKSLVPDDEFICSEFVQSALEYVRWQLSDKSLPSPADLAASPALVNWQRLK
jgi:hypothetical protein